MRTTRIAAATALCVAVTWGAPSTKVAASTLDVPLLWQAYVPTPRGEECGAGDGACNACITDVRAHFDSFENHGRENRSYWLRNDDEFAPYGVRGSSVTTNWSETDDGHIQSFVGLPIQSDNGRFWYAATHSETGSAGYLYLVEDDFAYKTPGGTRYVYPLETSSHPGGIQGVGSFLVVPHDTDNHSYYEVYDVSLPAAVRRTSRVHLPSRGAANVAVARLDNGGYLLISSRTSLADDYRYFYVDDLETMRGFKSLGTSSDAYWAENLSMITECGTGDLYVLAGGGDRIGPKNGTGSYARENLWSLYRVQRNAGRMALELIDQVEKDRSTECNARASGTAWVDRYEKLHVVCHEKLIGAIGEHGQGDFADYWIGRPSEANGAPGGPNSGGQPIQQK